MAIAELDRPVQLLIPEKLPIREILPVEKLSQENTQDPEYLWYTTTLLKLQSGDLEPGDVPVYILYENGVGNQEAAKEVAQLILEGKLVTRNYVTTYGIESRGEAVLSILKAKNEDSEPNRPVSTTDLFEGFYPQIDLSRVHPEFRDKEVFRNFVLIMENLGFVRYPLNPEVVNLPANAISDGQVQVYTRKHEDVLFQALRELSPETKILLSSANIKGQIEAIDPVYAYEFARQAGVSAFVVEDKNDLLYANKRHRFGSTPIIQVPRIEDVNEETGKIRVYVYRAANTDFESIERLILESYPDVEVIFCPDKPEDKRRKPYAIPEGITTNLHDHLYQSGVPNALPPYERK